MNYWSEKNAIVTGGGSGIGKQIALQLARRGARVTVTDLFPNRVEEIVADLRKIQPECDGFVVDHSKLQSNQEFHKNYFQSWKNLDILCANAGVGLGGTFSDTSLEDFEWVMGVNYWGVVYTLKQFLPHLISMKSGNVLVTASGAGLLGIPSMSAYCSTKFAMVGLVESMKPELKMHGVSISALCPGVIDTNIVKDGKLNLDNERSNGSNAQKVIEFFQKRGTSAEKVARDAIRGMEKGRTIIPTGGVSLPWLVKRASQRLQDQLLWTLWKLNPIYGRKNSSRE